MTTTRIRKLDVGTNISCIGTIPVGCKSCSVTPLQNNTIQPIGSSYPLLYAIYQEYDKDDSGFITCVDITNPIFEWHYVDSAGYLVHFRTDAISGTYNDVYSWIDLNYYNKIRNTCVKVVFSSDELRSQNIKFEKYINVDSSGSCCKKGRSTTTRWNKSWSASDGWLFLEGGLFSLVHRFKVASNCLLNLALQPYSATGSYDYSRSLTVEIRESTTDQIVINDETCTGSEPYSELPLGAPLSPNYSPLYRKTFDKNIYGDSITFYTSYTSTQYQILPINFTFDSKFINKYLWLTITAGTTYVGQVDNGVWWNYQDYTGTKVTKDEFMTFSYIYNKNIEDERSPCTDDSERTYYRQLAEKKYQLAPTKLIFSSIDDLTSRHVIVDSVNFKYYNPATGTYNNIDSCSAYYGRNIYIEITFLQVNLSNFPVDIRITVEGVDNKNKASYILHLCGSVTLSNMQEKIYFKLGNIPENIDIVKIIGIDIYDYSGGLMFDSIYNSFKYPSNKLNWTNDLCNSGNCGISDICIGP